MPLHAAMPKLCLWSPLVQATSAQVVPVPEMCRTSKQKQADVDTLVFNIVSDGLQRKWLELECQQECPEEMIYGIPDAATRGDTRISLPLHAATAAGLRWLALPEPRGDVTGATHVSCFPSTYQSQKHPSKTLHASKMHQSTVHTRIRPLSDGSDVCHRDWSLSPRQDRSAIGCDVRGLNGQQQHKEKDSESCSQGAAVKLLSTGDTARKGMASDYQYLSKPSAHRVQPPDADLPAHIALV